MAIQRVPSTTEYAASLTKRERSFAELYRQARQAQVNDNGQAEAEAVETEAETLRNRDYIAGLHDRVDTLRGEILARVITAGAPGDESRRNLAPDVSRLNARLETLRTKLHQEETRLSGHLLDIKV